MNEEKTKGQQLQELLFNKRENGVDFMDDAELGVCDDFCEGYKDFLYHCKTEREAAAQALDQARAAGFLPFDEFGDQLEPGAKVYKMNRGKAIILCVKGKRSIKDGVRIAAAHIDSPRIDLKQRPVYEDNGLALFKTHYYGGIKKYQWTAIPLSLHGRICKNDGTYVDVRLGEEPGDPKFCITDILPHLALEQYTRKINELIKGEELNIVIGSRPFKDDKASEKVKLNILNLLYEKYGIVERDLLSAELELVPAFTVDDLGFDRSLIGGYGHDDRVCAYPALQAILSVSEPPEYTCITVLTDKEETGSDGVSGMQSQAFEAFMADLCEQQDVALRHCFAKSFCLSADVCAAYDPSFPEVSAKRTEAKLNYGMGICKFTGARGKSGTSDASAELVAYLRRLFADNGVVWQLSEMGKVDQGGGGTIAKFMADRNIDTIDAGVPVLSMHAPFELVAKFDCWMTYRGVLAAYCDTQA